VLEPRTYADGEAVIREGDADHAAMRFYLIVKGTAVATQRAREGPGHAGGAAVAVGTMREGAYFGELALLRNAPRAATARQRFAEHFYRLELRVGHRPAQTLTGSSLDQTPAPL